MRPLFFCLLALWGLLFIHPVRGQFSLGAKMGISSPGLNPEEQTFSNPEQTNTYRLKLERARAGFHVGLAVRVQLGALLLQPELLYDTYTVEYELDRLVDGGGQSPVLTAPRERFHYLDFPLLVGLKLGPLRLHAGPEGHLYIGSDSDLTRFVGYSESFSSLQWGWETGLGLDIWKLTLDFRYEGRFNRFGNHIRLYGQESPFDQRMNRFLIQLGYRF